MEIAVGTVIDDRYEVLGRIGAGAVAEVYLARHLQLSSLVAVKILLLPTQAVQHRLLKEARLQNALRDRHVVTVIDVVDVGGVPGLVMEYVRGPSLHRLLQHLHFDLAQARALGTGILLGVRAAHQIGLVHRDLKPANVLVEVTDHALVPKISDFGLAKLLQPDPEGGAATRTGSTLGTPAYMAPEQIRDARQVDERADVFSLGAVLYELLTGRRAFPGDDLLDLYDHIRDGRYAPVRSLAPEVPPELEAVVDAALKVDREQRIGSVAELLDRWTDGKGEVAAELDWSPSALQIAAGLTPDRAIGSPSLSASASATFDFEPAPVGPETASVEWVRTTDQRPALRRRRRPPIVAGLVALGFVGAMFGCVGGTGLVGAGLATGYIQWGPRMAVPIDRARTAYTATDLPHVSADPAIELEVTAGWVALRDGRPAEAIAKIEPLLAGEVRSDVGVHLLLATALLWSGDGRAYDQIELAGTLAERRKGPVADLARVAAGGVHGPVDRDRVAAHLANWPDDLLAPLLLGSLDGGDLDQRIGLLRKAIDLDPARAGGRAVLVELEVDRGRFDEARPLLDESLEQFPDHPRLAAAQAAWLLRAGDPGGARSLAERAIASAAAAPAMFEPFAGALRVQGDVDTLDVIEARIGEIGDDASYVAFARGRAEAAFGLGKIEEGSDWLDRAYQRALGARRVDDLAALFRLDQGAALLVGRRDGVARAWDHGRTVAALSGMPSGLHDRLAPRLALLEGVLAAQDGDVAKAQLRLEELRAMPGAERFANLLVLATFGLHELPIPEGTTVEGCLPRTLQASWRDVSGVDPAAAEADWAGIVADDSPCQRYGLDRLARARAEAALARLAANREDVIAAEQHLAEVERWTPEPDLSSPVFEDLAIAQEQLVWLRQR